MSTLPETGVGLDTDAVSQVVLCCAVLSCAFCLQPSAVSRGAQNRPSLRTAARVTNTIFEFLFPPLSCQDHISPCARRQEAGRIVTQVACPCFFLCQNFCFPAGSRLPQLPFPWCLGSWGQLVTIIPVIDSHLFKEHC